MKLDIDSIIKKELFKHDVADLKLRNVHNFLETFDRTDRNNPPPVVYKLCGGQLDKNGEYDKGPYLKLLAHVENEISRAKQILLDDQDGDN